MVDIRIIQGDCLDKMKDIPDVSIDAIITDPPYGTTACKWDSVIPFEPMWEQLKRVIKPNGAIVLFGSQPFTSALIMSNIKMFKYEWIWDKTRGVGHLNAKKRPMMCTENILVFNEKGFYHPQMRHRDKPRKSQNKSTQNVYGKSLDVFNGEVLDKKYPVNLITFSKSDMTKNKFHPTQKPIALMEYLIKTYTQEGETVLDFTMGSGTTGVACVNTNRNFIGIELDEGYFNIAMDRINQTIAKLNKQDSLFKGETDGQSL